MYIHTHAKPRPQVQVGAGDLAEHPQGAQVAWEARDIHAYIYIYIYIQ